MVAFLFPFPPRGAVVSISTARSERGGGGGVRREGLRYIKLSPQLLETPPTPQITCM